VLVAQNQDHEQSFGLNGDSQLLKDAIRKARKQGAVIVASAGNSGSLFKRIDAPARWKIKKGALRIPGGSNAAGSGLLQIANAASTKSRKTV
jgi:subtilisin family serine protease